ncbi:MAG: TIGR04282 family arsenosugar biosynthesis glycosyltransferase [Opitutaceae bacterium]
MTAILLFIKAPKLGLVKTRLAKSIGDEPALSAYRKLVEAQVEALATTSKLQVHYTPSNAEQSMRTWLGPAADYQPQSDGDLTDRLKHGVTNAFAHGHDQVICIGGDCPNLSRSHIEQTERLLLRGCDIVFGPTEDGGYYLIGMKAPHTEVFEGIPWSSSVTLKASINKADELGLEIAQLETLYDVDTEAEWKRALEEGSLKA